MTARRAIGHHAGASVEDLAARVERARRVWWIESKTLARLPPNAARAKVESLVVARRQREAERFKSELRVLAAMVGAGAKGANEHWRVQPRVPAGERDAGNGRRREEAKEMHARATILNWRRRGGEADDPVHRPRGSGSVGNVINWT